MHGVALGLRLGDTGRGLAVLDLVEIGTEPLAGLFYLLLDLFVLLGEPLLDQHVGTVALLRILVVDQRIVEGAHVARSLPRAGVHEDRSVDADDVAVELDHRIPPVTLDVVLQLDTVLTVIVDGTQSVVDLARREYEAVLLAMGDQLFEKFFLCHRMYAFIVFSERQKYKINGNPGKEADEKRHLRMPGPPTGGTGERTARPQATERRRGEGRDPPK